MEKQKVGLSIRALLEDVEEIAEDVAEEAVAEDVAEDAEAYRREKAYDRVKPERRENARDQSARISASYDGNEDVKWDGNAKSRKLMRELCMLQADENCYQCERKKYERTDQSPQRSAEEIEKMQFHIYTPKTNNDVSWQITTNNIISNHSSSVKFFI